MRPNVATTLDPLNLKALPPTVGMEFDYRTQVWGDSLNAWVTVNRSVTVCILGLAAAVGLRLAGVATTTPLFLSIVTALGVFSAVRRVFYFDSPFSVLKTAAFGPLVWLLSVATNTPVVIVLFLVAFACALNVANHITRHYALWMHANVYLPRTVRQSWRSVWKPSEWYDYLLDAVVAPPDHANGSNELTDLEWRERSHYALGFAAVVAALLLAATVYLLCLPSLLAGFIALGLFVVVLLTYGVAHALAYDDRVDPWFLLHTVGRAYVSWLTYNAHGTHAPGVFQSPSGSVSVRYLRTGVTLFLISIAVLPVAAYFPLGLPVFGYEPFLQAAAAPMPWDDFSLKDFLAGRPNRSHSSPWTVTMELTREQTDYVRHLPAKEQDKATEDLIALNRAEAARTAAAVRLAGRPEVMVWVYVRGGITLDPRIILSAMFAFVGCLIAPPALLAAIGLAIGGRVLVHHYLTLEGNDAIKARYHPPVRPPLWDTYIRRLRESEHVARLPNRPDVRERDHLLLGFYEEQDYPVLLSPAVLNEHAHITGDSGAGKSALGMAPLLDQLIDRGEDSVVVFDLKGDMTLFESVRAAVNKLNARRGSDGPQVPFRWFTNRPDAATYAFNPFLQEDMQRVTPHQKVEIMIKSLGLEYGEGYGTSYYSSVHRFVLDRLLESNVQFNSFRELNEFFRDASDTVWKDSNIRPRLRDDATHLLTTVNALASVDALNVTTAHRLPPPVMDQRIDMGKVVRSPHVVYFYLHSAFEEAAVRAVAKLALHSLLVAAVRRGFANHRTYALVDEFQQVASEDLQIFLRQARSAKIPVILANQTLSDLRTKQFDLIPTVQGNTRFRQVFSASDLLQQRMIVDASGEAFYELFGYGESVKYGGKGTERTYSWNAHEEIGPRIRRNTVIQASDEELTSIVHVTRGHGFSQFGGLPFPIRCMFHIPLEEYRTRERAEWPAQDDYPGTIVPPLDTARSSPSARNAAPSSQTPRSAPPRVQKEFSDLEQRIDQLEETIP